MLFSAAIQKHFVIARTSYLIEVSSKKTCDKGAYCYNIAVDIGKFKGIPVAAGCSKWRCSLARNKCNSMILGGHKIKYCCCNKGDMCNSKSN
ncbi:hypothetical protein OESDEN_03438, partial [Oesophagostomum dentatum]